jgi:hypothetical protein
MGGRHWEYLVPKRAENTTDKIFKAAICVYFFATHSTVLGDDITSTPISSLVSLIDALE